ncbi:YciI family protein [Actinosynnema sp. NPDC050436]|uniref:YciI family protein n=1 Tax=Actinosynnema sp. NPDC050436 TaxID=3155659 RepID=UPI0033E62AFF
MYIVLLEYIKPLDEVDYALPDHVDWLNKQYQAGHFLASGRQVPRVGGVIIARPMLRGKLDALLATDPFAVQKLVRHRVVQFQATRTAPELTKVNEAALA